MRISSVQNYNGSFSSKRQFKKLFKTCAYSGEEFADNQKKSIEHIIPTSKGGQNEYANYIVVDRNWNILRSSTPLAVFIQKYPEVKENIKKTVNEFEGQEIEGIIWSDEVKKNLEIELGEDIFK